MARLGVCVCGGEIDKMFVSVVCVYNNLHAYTYSILFVSLHVIYMYIVCVCDMHCLGQSAACEQQNKNDYLVKLGKKKKNTFMINLDQWEQFV